jgi:hypothetical protein
MSKQLFSLEYSLPNTVLPRRALKDVYRARVEQIKLNGGPAMIGGDPEAVPSAAAVPAAAAAVQAETSTSLIFCYTEKFNQPRQTGWTSRRFINQDEQYLEPAAAGAQAAAAAAGAQEVAAAAGAQAAAAAAGAQAAAAAGAAVRNDVIVKWQTGLFSSKMNYERPKNVFVLEGIKDFGGSRGDVDLLGSVEDHDKLITEIKKLFPNGANLAQPHPDEVCDEWLTTPPNASDTFWGNEIKKKGIEKGKDEKVLEAAKGTDFDPEMLRIIKYLHRDGIRKFLFDAGIKKIGANAPINISQGVSINPKKDFYYTASFDAAPEIAGYGVGIFKQPPLGPNAGAPSANDEPEGVEKGIDNWVNINIIRPLGPIEGYFIQPGLDCNNGFLFEISVYTKNALDNLEKVVQPIITKLQQVEEKAKKENEDAEGEYRKSNDTLYELQRQKGELHEKLTKAKLNANQNAIKAASEKETQIEIAEKNAIDKLAEVEEWYNIIQKETQGITNANEETKIAYNELQKISIKHGSKLSILRYLVFLPKNTQQEAITSITIPSQDYELSITQARYNYKSFQHPEEAIKILPFNDCKFYEKIKDFVSDTEKAAFCVLQKWNCDQNDAILNALVPYSCLLSVDKPAIAATIARGGNAFLFGDKSGNGIYKNKKFYKILNPPVGAAAGAGTDNYMIFSQRGEPASVAADERKRRRKVAAEAAVEAAADPARALAGRVSAATTAAEAAAARAEARAARGAARGAARAEQAAAQAAAQAARAAAGGAMNERHRYRYSRKPNKPRRRSTRKHKN